MRSGIAIENWLSGAPEAVLRMLSLSQATHSRPSISRDTATSAAVQPSAIASGRHSRRTANQTSPTPGVTLVRSTNDQATG